MLTTKQIEKVNDVCRRILEMCENEGLTMFEMERVAKNLEFDITSRNSQIKETTPFTATHKEDDEKTTVKTVTAHTTVQAGDVHVYHHIVPAVSSFHASSGYEIKPIGGGTCGGGCGHGCGGCE